MRSILCVAGVSLGCGNVLGISDLEFDRDPAACVGCAGSASGASGSSGAGGIATGGSAAGNGAGGVGGAQSSGGAGSGAGSAGRGPCIVGCGQDPVAPPKLAGGGIHTCQLQASGAARCWGSGLIGELGDGSSMSSAEPVAVEGLSGVIQISATTNKTCALLADGRASCWGLGARPLDEIDPYGISAVPVDVQGLIGAAQISINSVGNPESLHCAVMPDAGNVLCWGAWDVLGKEGEPPPVTPGPNDSLAYPYPWSDVIQIDLGWEHICALMSDRTVECAGLSSHGQLGTGVVALEAFSPTPVPGVEDVAQISVGAYHTCALIRDGRIQCWGAANLGQLGNGVVTFAQATPVWVSGIAGAIQIDAGAISTCALLEDGTARCWGAGALGDGAYYKPDPQVMPSPTPVTVLLDDIREIMTSTLSCAERNDGSVWCWGDLHLDSSGVPTTRFLEPVEFIDAP